MNSSSSLKDNWMAKSCVYTLIDTATLSLHLEHHTLVNL